MHSFPHPLWGMLSFCYPPLHLRCLPAEGELGKLLGHVWGSSVVIQIRQESVKSSATWGPYRGGEAVVQSLAGSVPVEKRGPRLRLLQEHINPTEEVGYAAGLSPRVFPIPPWARCLLKPLVRAGPGCLRWGFLGLLRADFRLQSWI